MNFRPAISVPLPWLSFIAGRIMGRKGIKNPSQKKHSAFRFPRSLSITSEGKWFIGILLIIGVAAINTGNNLLYLIVATLLSLIIISGLLSESALRGVRVKRVLPRRVFKDRPVSVRLSAVNRKSFLPSFSLNVKESDSPEVKAEPAYFLKLNPIEEASRTARYTFTKRGVATLPSLKISTRFPFGLFVKGKKDETAEEVLVYPAVTQLKSAPVIAASSPSEGFNKRMKGEGVELYGLRDYTLNDDSRHIHWKSAAKTSRLFMKEYERESEKRVKVFFENYPAPEEAFERLTDEAASLAAYFIGKGYGVGLKTLTEEVNPDTGGEHLDKMLKSLALIKPTEAKGIPSVKILAE